MPLPRPGVGHGVGIAAPVLDSTMQVQLLADHEEPGSLLRRSLPPFLDAGQAVVSTILKCSDG